MKILLAPDKFKGSLTAQEVCAALAEGLQPRYPKAALLHLPLADGGDGTLHVFQSHLGGETKTVEVLDPLFRPIPASYVISDDHTVAFIEMAEASGLRLLKPSERNPSRTTSFGTGQLIAHALDQGVQKIILSIGGSATNDAGMGMANALGYEFVSEKLEPLVPIGKSLKVIGTIEPRHVHSRLGQAQVIVLCDVDNPLFGSNGAAFVYGPQKGASKEECAVLDEGLQHFHEVVMRQYGIDLNFPGAGAAGGLGAGCKLFLSAKIQSGISYVSQLAGLEEKIRSCEEIITGEGQLDEQSFSGKVVGHVARLARQYQKPLTVVCGRCSLDHQYLTERGIQRIICLADHDSEVDEAMKNAAQRIMERVQRF